VRAFILDRHGKKSSLRLGEVPEPELRQDDVLVEVHAAAVNLLDAKLRDGEFKLVLPYRFPLVLGHDVAGVVVRVGTGVKRFQVGDEVYARPDDGRIGTFAERISIHEDSVAPRPARLTMEEAASIPLVGLTAWQALVEKGNLRPGQKVLIQAGSGGVGTFAIQLARHLGAFVATTTSASNAQWVKRLGADLVIDYQKEDFGDVLLDYDLVVHSQGAEALDGSLRVLRPGGRLVSISGPPDPAFARRIGKPWVLRPIMAALSSGIRRKARRKQVDYSFLFMRASGAQLRELTALIDSGAVRPVVDRVFPFEATSDALAFVEAGRAKGKVVIKVR
jgi:NADPH:quinone reductase-like Zn-dependent oxidoreductase